jgi:O-antigen ligase
MTSSLLKWILAAVGLGLVPLAAFVLRRWPRLLHASFVLAGFLPFIGLHYITINVISMESYRGDARGIELTGLDLLLAAIFFASPSHGPTPYRRTLAVYFCIALASLASALVPILSVFGVWKLARMCFVVAAVWRACSDSKAAPRFLKGLHLGVIYEAILVAWQHFGQHRFQAPGNLSHPNSLTMTCNLVAPVALALVLSGAKSRLAPWTLGAALACSLFGLSRGSLVMFVLFVLFVYAGSLGLGVTRRKLILGGVGFVLALAVGVKALPTIVSRFEHAPSASGDARKRFEAAAKLMLSDHPMGVGINQFAEVMEHQHYSERVGIPPNSIDSGATVHNIYYLTAAELGLLGLVVYLLLLSLALRLAWTGMRKAGDGVLGHVLLGCVASLMIVCIQGTLEWLSRQTAFSYVFFMMLALIATLHAEVIKRSTPA